MNFGKGVDSSGQRKLDSEFVGLRRKEVSVEELLSLERKRCSKLKDDNKELKRLYTLATLEKERVETQYLSLLGKNKGSQQTEDPMSNVSPAGTPAAGRRVTFSSSDLLDQTVNVDAQLFDKAVERYKSEQASQCSPRDISPGETESLRQECASLQNQINDLLELLESRNTEIGELKQELRNCECYLSDLQEDLSTKQRELISVSGEFDLTKRQLEEANLEKEELEVQLFAWEKEVAAREAETRKQEAEFSELKASSNVDFSLGGPYGECTMFSMAGQLRLLQQLHEQQLAMEDKNTVLVETAREMEKLRRQYEQQLVEIDKHHTAQLHELRTQSAAKDEQLADLSLKYEKLVQQAASRFASHSVTSSVSLSTSFPGTPSRAPHSQFRPPVPPPPLTPGSTSGKQHRRLSLVTPSKSSMSHRRLSAPSLLVSSGKRMLDAMKPAAFDDQAGSLASFPSTSVNPSPFPSHRHSAVGTPTRVSENAFGIPRQNPPPVEDYSPYQQKVAEHRIAQLEIEVVDLQEELASHQQLQEEAVEAMMEALENLKETENKLKLSNLERTQLAEKLCAVTLNFESTRNDFLEMARALAEKEIALEASSRECDTLSTRLEYCTRELSQQSRQIDDTQSALKEARSRSESRADSRCRSRSGSGSGSELPAPMFSEEMMSRVTSMLTIEEESLSCSSKLLEESALALRESEQKRLVAEVRCRVISEEMESLTQKHRQELQEVRLGEYQLLLSQFQDLQGQFKAQYEFHSKEIKAREENYALLEASCRDLANQNELLQTELKSAVLSRVCVQVNARDDTEATLLTEKIQQGTAIYRRQLEDEFAVKAAKYDVMYGQLQEECQDLRKDLNRTRAKYQSLVKEQFQNAGLASSSLDFTSAAECEDLRQELSEVKTLHREQVAADSFAQMLKDSNAMRDDMIRKLLDEERLKQQLQFESLNLELQEEVDWLKGELRRAQEQDNYVVSSKYRQMELENEMLHAQVSELERQVQFVRPSLSHEEAIEHAAKLQKELSSLRSILRETDLASQFNCLEKENHRLNNELTNLQKDNQLKEELNTYHQIKRQGEVLNQDLARKQWAKKQKLTEYQFNALYEELQEERFWLKEELATSRKTVAELRDEQARDNSRNDVLLLAQSEIRLLSESLKNAKDALEICQQDRNALRDDFVQVSQELRYLRETPAGEIQSKYENTLLQLEALKKAESERKEAAAFEEMLRESNWVKEGVAVQQQNRMLAEQIVRDENLHSEMKEENHWLKEQLSNLQKELKETEDLVETLKTQLQALRESKASQSMPKTPVPATIHTMRSDQLRDDLLAKLDSFSRLSTPLYRSGVKVKAIPSDHEISMEGPFSPHSDRHDDDLLVSAISEGEEVGLKTPYSLRTRSQAPPTGTTANPSTKFLRSSRPRGNLDNCGSQLFSDVEADAAEEEVEPVEKARLRVAEAKANVDRLQFELTSAQDKHGEVLVQLNSAKMEISRTLQRIHHTDTSITSLAAAPIDSPNKSEQMKSLKSNKAEHQRQLEELRKREAELLAASKTVGVELDSLRTKLGVACQEIDEATVSLSKVLAMEAKLSEQIDVELRERLVAMGSELLQSAKSSLFATSNNIGAEGPNQQSQHPQRYNNPTSRHAHLLSARLVALSKELNLKTERANHMERKNVELMSKLNLLEERLQETQRELEVLRQLKS